VRISGRQRVRGNRGTLRGKAFQNQEVDWNCQQREGELPAVFRGSPSGGGGRRDTAWPWTNDPETGTMSSGNRLDPSSSRASPCARTNEFLLVNAAFDGNLRLRQHMGDLRFAQP
jgi:hypothetical protein